MVKKSKKCVIKVGDIYETQVAGVRCTRLPEFLRAKKNLGAPFCVYVSAESNFAPDNTKVTVSAGNAKNPDAEMRNNVAYLKNGIAEFKDLRFVGKSGRGSRFNVYIRFDTSPEAKLVTYANAIKVTVDGPRPARRIAKSVKVGDLSVIADKLKSAAAVGETPMGVNNVPLKKRYRDLFLVDENPLLTALCPDLTPPQTPKDTSLTGSSTADLVYREFLNSYLLIYMDLYKIKVTKQMVAYLVDLIINNHACGLLRHNNFLSNFNLFYQCLSMKSSTTTSEDNSSSENSQN